MPSSLLTCRCCNTTYDVARFSELQPASGGSIWDDDLIETHLEARNCSCGNTLFLELEPVELVELAEVHI